MNVNEINNLIKDAKENKEINTKQINDVHHSFGDLYFHRMILFSKLCLIYKDKAWKTKKHYDNDHDPMFPGDFLVGINTKEGVVSYHFKLEYWDYFKDIKEIEHGPKWDNEEANQTVKRILSL